MHTHYLEKMPLIYKKKINSDVSYIYSIHQVVFRIAEDNRAISGIKRAKGNEAFRVYLLSSF